MPKKYDPETFDKLINNLDQQIKNYHKSIGLMQQMRRLFLLAKLEPRVVTGKYRHSLLDLGGRGARLSRYKLVISYRVGEPDEGDTEFDLKDVPREFWPDDVVRYVRKQELAKERAFARACTSQ